MVSTIFSTAGVTEPAIKSCSNHLESRRYIRFIGDPRICAVQKTMLEENNWFSYVALISLNA